MYNYKYHACKCLLSKMVDTLFIYMYMCFCMYICTYVHMYIYICKLTNTMYVSVF